MPNILVKQERRALSIRETAQTCGLSRATIYRLIEQAKLTTLKIGARRRLTAACRRQGPVESASGDVSDLLEVVRCCGRPRYVEEFAAHRVRLDNPHW
jgi:excisionase family DNA binding protein